MAKEVNDVVNTTATLKQQKTDVQLQAEQFKKAKGISEGPRKKFKCSSIYASLYPNGFLTTYQGIIINLVFDNREVELPEVVVNYIESKFQDKADREAEKLNKFKTKKQEKLGEYAAE